MNEFIDHTFLRPTGTIDNITNLCNEALKYNFYSVCVAPIWIQTVNGMIKKNSPVKICSVIGFPHGNTNVYDKVSQIKYLEHSYRIDEFDVVINIGAIKSATWAIVDDEIKSIRNATSKVIKYIIEIGTLEKSEIERVCSLLIQNNINFVKTCTGYTERNEVSVEDIKLLKSICKDKIKIKASGGIKDLTKAIALIDAGANRIGCSASVNIIKEIL